MGSRAPSAEPQVGFCRTMEHRAVGAADRGAKRRWTIDRPQGFGNLEELVGAHGIRPRGSRSRDGEDDTQVTTLLRRDRSVPSGQEPVVRTAYIIAGRTRDRVEHDDLVSVVSDLRRAVESGELGEAVADHLDRAMHRRRKAACAFGVRLRVHGFTIRATPTRDG